ncbi:MAG TPA: ACT domain-containing protein [Candidatus Elarobacter sp.]
MPGETDLRALLAGMTPTLRPEEYVFRTLPPGDALPDGIVPFATVREDEGLSVVIERVPGSEPVDADRYRAITLGVHSSLNAVGLIAAVARALADAGIPANVIAGFHHDHVLVPAPRADHAFATLCGLVTRQGDR